MDKAKLRKPLALAGMALVIVIIAFGYWWTVVRWPSGDAIETGKTYAVFVRYAEVASTKPAGMAWDPGDGIGAKPDPSYEIGQATIVHFTSPVQKDTDVFTYTPGTLGKKPANRFLPSWWPAMLGGGKDAVITCNTMAFSTSTLDQNIVIRFVDNDRLVNDDIETFTLAPRTLVEGDNELPCAGTSMVRVVVRVVEVGKSVERAVERIHLPVD